MYFLNHVIPEYLQIQKYVNSRISIHLEIHNLNSKIIYVCIQAYMYVCSQTCMRICMCVCMCIIVYIHACINEWIHAYMLFACRYVCI